MQLLVLPTEAAVGKFFGNVSRMSAIDFNLDEIGFNLIEILTYRDNVVESAARYVEGYRCLNQPYDLAAVDDNDILADAIAELLWDVKRVVDRAVVYDSSGVMPYVFYRWLHDDLVLSLWEQHLLD